MWFPPVLSVRLVRKRGSAEPREWKPKTKPWFESRETKAGGRVWSPRFRLPGDEKAMALRAGREIGDSKRRRDGKREKQGRLIQQYNVALHYLNLPAEVLGDDVFSKEMHVAFDEGIEELCVGRETSCDKSALRRVCMGLGDPSQHTEVCNPPSGCPHSGHGGAELLGLQLRFRGLHLEEVDQAGAGGCESAGAVTGRQQAVFVPQRPGVNRISFCLQGEDVLEGRGGAGSAVGVPHGEGDGTGTGLPRAPAAGQVFAHGPLEVPHEERVDDGVHGAVAVPQPGEHVEEAGRDTATDCLAGGHSKG